MRETIKRAFRFASAGTTYQGLNRVLVACRARRPQRSPSNISFHGYQRGERREANKVMRRPQTLWTRDVEYPKREIERPSTQKAHYLRQCAHRQWSGSHFAESAFRTGTVVLRRAEQKDRSPTSERSHWIPDFAGSPSHLGNTNSSMQRENSVTPDRWVPQVQMRQPNRWRRRQRRA